MLRHSHAVLLQRELYDNAELQRYYEDEVVPEKKETQRVNSILLPDLDKLFEFIKDHDSRLYQTVLHVGSYYQGLKTRRSDEFDYTLCIRIKADQVKTHHGSRDVFYGFKGCDTEKERLAHTIPQVQYVDVFFRVVLVINFVI